MATVWHLPFPASSTTTVWDEFWMMNSLQDKRKGTFQLGGQYVQCTAKTWKKSSETGVGRMNADRRSAMLGWLWAFYAVLKESDRYLGNDKWLATLVPSAFKCSYTSFTSCYSGWKTKLAMPFPLLPYPYFYNSVRLAASYYGSLYVKLHFGMKTSDDQVRGSLFG